MSESIATLMNKPMQVGRGDLYCIRPARELYPVTVLDPIVRIWAWYETGLRHLATGRELLLKGELPDSMSHTSDAKYPMVGRNVVIERIIKHSGTKEKRLRLAMSFSNIPGSDILLAWRNEGPAGV